MTAAPRVRTGIGGWTFDAWRGGGFYPPGLRAAGEFAHAARTSPRLKSKARSAPCGNPPPSCAGRPRCPMTSCLPRLPALGAHLRRGHRGRL